MNATELKGIIWLHTLRLWRYKWSFLNMVISEAMWMFIFILGILLFVPSEYIAVACKGAFWIIVSWQVISQVSTIMGGWMQFFISLGMIEEHILRGISPFKVIMGRVVPGLSVTAGTMLFMAFILNTTFKTNVTSMGNPALICLGLVFLMIQALSYGLILSAISVKTGIPHSMLEFTSFLIVGLLLIPIENFQFPLNLILLAIPYVAPVNLVKDGAFGTSILVVESVVLSLVISGIFIYLAIKFVKSAEKLIKTQGVKAIGLM